MIERAVEELGSLVEAVERSGHPPNGHALSRIADSLAATFKVDSDEVAILSLNPKGKNLQFIIPEKLAAVGTIPLTSTNSLAARTARERRPELSNAFASARHATVFEGVPLGRRSDELIQKIMSVPILDGARVAGVVQISRKGRSPADAGPDFTQKDLRTLASLGPALDRFLKLCPPA